jgi:hypothetical protein
MSKKKKQKDTIVATYTERKEPTLEDLDKAQEIAAFNYLDALQKELKLRDELSKASALRDTECRILADKRCQYVAKKHSLEYTPEIKKQVWSAEWAYAK